MITRLKSHRSRQPRGFSLTVFALIVALGGCGSDGSGPTAVVSASGATQANQFGVPTEGDPDLTLVADLPAPVSSLGGVEDVIIRGDILQIEVFGVEKLNRTPQVDAAGRITLPLIGQVSAAGKSVLALQREVTALYEKSYLHSPNIILQVKDSPARSVVLDGQIARSGVYPVTLRTTLLESIAQAGGLSDVGDPSKVFVFRTVDGKRYVANYNIVDIRNGKRLNPRVYGGDTIAVFSSGGRVAWQNLKDVLGVGGRFVTGGVAIK
jgi:polysaccharide export outer membrane protein